MTLPPGLTRHGHYDNLPLSPYGKGHTWTRESALMALALYVHDVGHLPLTSQLQAAEGLPNHQTIDKLFGGFQAWLHALDADPPAPPAYAKEVACPRCDRRWTSPDARHFRQCPACRAAIRNGLENESGDWMNGEAIVHAGLAGEALWEDYGDDA